MTLNREAKVSTNLNNFLAPVETGSVSTPFSVSSPAVNGIVLSNGNSAGVSATPNVTYNGSAFSVTGNSSTSGSTTLTGGLIYGNETISSGALSPLIPVSFLDISGTVAYGLSDGAASGTVKYLFVKNVENTPAGTLTPTSTTGLWSTAAFDISGQSLTLLWDGAGWGILGRQSGAAAIETAVADLPVIA